MHTNNIYLHEKIIKLKYMIGTNIIKQKIY